MSGAEEHAAVEAPTPGAPWLAAVLAWRWRLVAVLFLAGLAGASTIFLADHQEPDELIYMTLVDQLERGNGYTLQGTLILEQGVIDRQYDTPLYWHPPGGVALFWLLCKAFGPAGLPLAQLLAYTLFFWSMMLLVVALDVAASDVGLALAALLSACSPIAISVTRNYWLDGPALGFATAAVALFAWAVRRRSRLAAVAAGVLLGYAGLIKMTAGLTVVPALLVAWLLLERPRGAALLRYALLLLVPAGLVQLPWEICLWWVLGTPFPTAASTPSATLLESNPYVYYLTVVRSPWVYLTLLPRVLWTLVPSLGLLALLWRDRDVRRRALWALAWIACVVGAHVALGFAGYPKLLRLVVLVTPPAIVLASALLAAAVEHLRAGDWTGRRRVAATALVAVALLGVGLEVAAGVRAAVQYEADLVTPLFGGPG